MRNFFLLIPLLILACAATEPTEPNTLVIGIETGPATLDPRYATDAVSTNISGLVYSGLFKRNAKMALEPELASGVRRPDGLTYVIELKKGVRFHSGEKFSARDVRYTFESILNKKSASPKRSALEKIKSIKTPDPHTVVITLKEPFAPFMGSLTIGIVPENSDDLKKNPAGTGPFRFVDYERGSRLRLAANKDYFGGAPELSGVIFKILPDETVRLLELKKGGVHLVQNPITPAVLPWLEKQDGIVVKKMEGTNVSYIGFNMQDKILSNVKVRRAIAHAIDRESIIRYLLKNLAVKTPTLLASANPFHDGELAGIGYDPEKSKKLLDEAGYRNPGGGKPRFRLTYKTSKNPTRKKIAEIIAQQLSKVGIKITIKSFEWGTFFSDIKNGNFQMYSLTWVGIADPDIYHYIFHSKNVPPKGANRGRYVNAALDALLDKGRRETEFANRKKIYGEVQKIIYNDAPYVHLWVSVNVAAMNRMVKGFEMYPDESLGSLAHARLEE
ncbi:MAG: peptide-binding protein [bacterium]|nr:MAG: peptide-binding protein [bacterium]